MSNPLFGPRKLPKGDAILGDFQTTADEAAYVAWLIEYGTTDDPQEVFDVLAKHKDHTSNYNIMQIKEAFIKAAMKPHLENFVYQAKLSAKFKGRYSVDNVFFAKAVLGQSPWKMVHVMDFQKPSRTFCDLDINQFQQQEDDIYRTTQLRGVKISKCSVCSELFTKNQTSLPFCSEQKGLQLKQDFKELAKAHLETLLSSNVPNGAEEFSMDMAGLKAKII